MPEEIILVDATGGDEVPTKSEGGGIVDEKMEEFRSILKNAAMKKNVDNITEGFFRGDITDREFLVELLENFRVSPENVNAIFYSWFGEFPNKCGIDIYRPRRKKTVNEDEEESDIDFVKNAEQRRVVAMRNKLNMLEAQKMELELQKEINAFKSDDKKMETKERIEPVIVMGDDGKIEVAKDSDGNVITKKIVEPIATATGGSSITEMMMMQQLMGGSNRNNGSSGIAEIKIQSLEAEIARNKDRYDSEMVRLRDKLENKDAEIARMREDKDREVTRIREDKDREIAALKEKHEDKIEIIKDKYDTEMKHAEDRWADKENYYIEKVDKIDRDFRDQVEGIRAKYENDIARIRSDHQRDIEVFVGRAGDDLDSLKSVYNLQVSHRDRMDEITAAAASREREMERKIEEWKNMSDADRSTTRMIEAAGDGINKLLDVFGKPIAAGMQTQAIATQQLMREQEIAKLRNAGYDDETIANMIQPQVPNYDDVYEQVLVDKPVDKPEPVSAPAVESVVEQMEQTVEVPQSTSPVVIAR